MPETILLPPPLWEEDTPRVHRNDPETSHEAADKSAVHLSEVKAIIVKIFQHDGPLAAFEVNEIYRHGVRYYGWPFVSYETPRKRVSDLFNNGVLERTAQRRTNPEGQSEVVLAVKP